MLMEISLMEGTDESIDVRQAAKAGRAMHVVLDGLKDRNCSIPAVWHVAGKPTIDRLKKCRIAAFRHYARRVQPARSEHPNHREKLAVRLAR